MTKEILIKSAIKLLVNEQIKQGSWGYALEEDSAYEVSWKDVLNWLDQQPNEDCISRQAVLDIWHTHYSNIREENEEIQYKKIAFELPSVTPKQKVGKWIGHREHCESLGVIPSGLGAYKWCSNCDCGIDVKEFHMNHYNFCPNCGMKMTESEE